ncbi:restriction modification system DNA specificity subunit [Paenibacillus sp. FSL R7-277]|uniref:restriction endonuclease subunit S n=1 Tax=Paenibacillus sp. FSL R7-277 TaxID=1227352 RepID=UPI0003E224F2|nr:restriction endonuclease subunit S [Paenibacillus sp. FSL R7-277]ETT61689.1 restriction modification system DNA specificity subunit [Paenibacillus sp. FSL R7-277]
MGKIKYRATDELKYSGVEWLGEIPKKWGIPKIKYNSIKITQGPNPNYDLGISDENSKYKVLKTKDVYDDVIYYNSADSITFYTYKGCIKAKLKNDDILIGIVGKGSIGKVNVFKYKGGLQFIFTRALGLIRVNRNSINPYFLNYVFRSNYGKEIINFGIIGSTGQEVLQTAFISDIKFPMPKISEQNILCNFLDIKIAQFDFIISKKEQLIQKLEEAKKSLISEVVTGKLKIVDGDTVKRQPGEMKESGIEWIGLIPRGWAVKKLGYLLNFKNGVNADAGQYGNGIKFINVKEVIDNDILTYQQIPNKVKISKQKIAENIVVNGDVLFNRTSETAEEIGMTTVYKDCERVVFGGFVIRGREIKNDLILNFKRYCFNSIEVRKQLISYASGSIRKNIGQGNLKNVYLTFPEKSEQELITNYLIDKERELINIIKKSQLQIQRLRQAKQSLISEAVTGKIDLKDWGIIEEGE